MTVTHYEVSPQGDSRRPDQGDRLLGEQLRATVCALAGLRNRERLEQVVRGRGDEEQTPCRLRDGRGGWQAAVKSSGGRSALSSCVGEFKRWDGSVVAYATPAPIRPLCSTTTTSTGRVARARRWIVARMPLAPPPITAMVPTGRQSRSDVVMTPVYNYSYVFKGI